MGLESNANRMQSAIDIVDRVARGKIPEGGWTLLITSWDDGTFLIEYRHQNDKGIHRFFYQPHQDPENILYAVYTMNEMEKSEEGRLELGSTATPREPININTAPKAAPRVHSFEYFDLMKQRGVPTNVTVEISFDAGSFKTGAFGKCINYKLLKSSDLEVSSIDEFTVEDLLAMQCAMEAVLFNVIRPKVRELLDYEKNVEKDIEKMIDGATN
jgi:hypothetical protein